jgi:Domain of unknown function (DUF4365)
VTRGRPSRGIGRPGKRRTREHVIADLSVNFVERQALIAGFTVDRLPHDYGVDLILSTYNDDGFVEPGQVLVQVKATESLSVSADGQSVSIRVETAHLARWLAEMLPVILVVYDVANDVAFWTHVQGDSEHLELLLSSAGMTRTIHLSMLKRVDASGMRDIAQIRDGLQARARREARRHG